MSILSILKLPPLSQYVTATATQGQSGFLIIVLFSYTNVNVALDRIIYIIA